MQSSFPENNAFQLLRPGLVLVDHGPITMTIDAAQGNSPFTGGAVAGAKRALIILAELVKNLFIARLLIGEMPVIPPGCPSVLCKMIYAVRLLGEPDFTPMAAVAGAVAESVMEEVLAAGATRVIVNNGGDIALHIPSGERVRVGIASNLTTRSCTHLLEVTGESGIGGIATSGLGGRSLTKGIATAAVALAETASVADAAATAIANSTYFLHSGIKRGPAEKIDPGTDIRGQLVTLSVEELPEDVKRGALKNGARSAGLLLQRHVLKGWAIFVDNHVASCPENLLVPLQEEKTDGCGIAR